MYGCPFSLNPTLLAISIHCALSKFIKALLTFDFSIPKELKKRLQHKSHGKWNLCMDLTTLKKTINALIQHKCIIVSEPTEKQCKKKNPAYDDNIIKLTRRLKDINNVGYIEIYAVNVSLNLQ